ncbi:putative hydrolase [Paramyrothecium foliicola]|nr:putative hydrolase [Paramyrothecium foliicola]
MIFPISKGLTYVLGLMLGIFIESSSCLGQDTTVPDMVLEVPIDHLNQDLGTTNIALIKLRGKNASDDSENIIINPGGPGGSGVETLLKYRTIAGQIFGEQYNFVSFDPRGVNNSGLVADCFHGNLNARTAFYDLHRTGATNISDSSFRTQYYSSSIYAAWCDAEIQRNNTYGYYVTTPAVARDLLVYIEAEARYAGKPTIDAKIWYYGISYGTAIGTTFASMFPDRVGRMILDGVLDAEDYYTNMWRSNLAQMDDAIAAFTTFCYNANSTKCSFWDSSPVAIRSRLDNIIEQLRDAPVPIANAKTGGVPILVTYADLKSLFISAIYETLVSFPMMADTLRAFETGNASALGGLMKSFYPPRDWGNIIKCADSYTRNELLTIDDYREYAEFAQDQSKYIGDIYPIFAQTILCKSFNITIPGHMLFQGMLPPSSNYTSFPILFTSNTIDPITPMISARRMAAGFPGSVVLAQEAVGHSVANQGGSPCYWNHVQAYLRGVVPPSNITCPQQFIPFIHSGILGTSATTTPLTNEPLIPPLLGNEPLVSPPSTDVALITPPLSDEPIMSALGYTHRGPDDILLKSYERQGICMVYRDQENREKSLRPCKGWCAKHDGRVDVESYEGSYGCDGSVPLELDPDSMKHFTDDDGLEYRIGVCICEFPLAIVIFDIMAALMEVIGDIVCNNFIPLFSFITEVGLMFIPGAAVVRTVAKTIQYAKSAFENGLSAADFFGGFFGDTCGVPSWDFKIDTMFDDLVNAPDSMMGELIPTGCVRKDKFKCKKLDQKPDPPAKTKIHQGRSTQKEVQKPTSTKTKEPEPTCKIGKRAAPPSIRVGKLGEVEKTSECHNGKTTHHWTTTDKVIGKWTPKAVPQTCKKEWGQACSHYRSVMSVHSATKSMTEWTCWDTTSTNLDGKATEAWGNTAISRLPSTAQHWWPWANGIIYRERNLDNTGKQKTDIHGKLLWHGCDRDEWPPRYFWPGDEAAHKNNMVQRVRFIHWKENQDAGHLWSGFCTDHHATSRKNGKDVIQSDYITSDTNENKVITKTSGGITTIHTTVTISTAHVIFSIGDWDGQPKDDNDGLYENICWPSQLVPDDPGWALLTNDEWYTRSMDKLQYIASYRNMPDLQSVQAAAFSNAGNDKIITFEYDKIHDLATKLNFKNENAMLKYFKKLTKGRKSGAILPDYFGQLPGIPKYTGQKRKRSIAEVVALNETLDALDFEEIDMDAIQDDIESLSDEELEDWLEQYLELAEQVQKSQHTHDAPSSTPLESQAQATPSSDGEASTTPAAAGSIVMDKIPHQTGKAIN